MSIVNIWVHSYRCGTRILSAMETESGLFWCSLYCTQARPNLRWLVLWSGVSNTIIALSCSPKLSPTGEQTAKHDGLYPLLSVSLTVPPFVERFLQHNNPCRIGFYPLAFLSFEFHKWVVHTNFRVSNVASPASLAISFDMYNVEILHHAQIGQCIYGIRTYHIYI